MGLSPEELDQQTTECLPARDVMSSLGSSGPSDLLPREITALVPGDVAQVTNGVTAAVPALPGVPMVPADADIATLPAVPTLPVGLPL